MLLKIKSYIPNIITIIRLIGSAAIVFVKPLSGYFYFFYLLCGISDVLDGYIARRTDTASPFGAVLDSIADAIFVFVMLFVLIPIMPWRSWMLYWIGTVAIIRLLSLVVGFVRYKTLAFLHTYANKATGLLLFGFPLLYKMAGLTITAFLLCGVASISAAEELFINLTSKKLNRNVRSIYTIQ